MQLFVQFSAVIGLVAVGVISYWRGVPVGESILAIAAPGASLGARDRHHSHPHPADDQVPGKGVVPRRRGLLPSGREREGCTPADRGRSTHASQNQLSHNDHPIEVLGRLRNRHKKANLVHDSG